MLQINSNGVISFGGDFIELSVPWSDWTRFPISENSGYSVPLVAPYWTSIQTSDGGNVWYRRPDTAVPTNEYTQQLLKVEDIITTVYPGLATFNASEFLFINTWDRVAGWGFTNEVKRCIHSVTKFSVLS